MASGRRQPNPKYTVSTIYPKHNIPLKSNLKYSRNPYKYLDDEENTLNHTNDYKARVGRPVTNVSENFSVYDSYDKNSKRNTGNQDTKYFRAENQSK